MVYSSPIMDRLGDATALINSMRLAKLSVYETLVLVWRHSRPVSRNIRQYFRPIGFPPLFWPNCNCEVAGSTDWRRLDGHRGAGIRGLHESGYGVVRSR